jgi:hypothetical protein
MSNEHSPETCDCSRTLQGIKAQCDQLQQIFHELEEQKKRDTEALAAVREELTEYRTFFYRWARLQIREEDWQGFAEEDFKIVPEDVIAELECQE